MTQVLECENRMMLGVIVRSAEQYYNWFGERTNIERMQILN